MKLETVFIACVREFSNDLPTPLLNLYGRLSGCEPVLVTKDAEYVELQISLMNFIILKEQGYLPNELVEAFEKACRFNSAYNIDPKSCVSMQGPWVPCNIKSAKWPETLLTIQPV